MNYHLIVFDWEGTLGDTLGQILVILIEEAEKLHLNKPADNIIRKNLVYGLNFAVNKLFSTATEKERYLLLNAVQQRFVIESSKEYLIPGALNFVKKVKDAGINIAIATNKSNQSLLRVLKATKLDMFFTVTRAAGQVAPKPAPQMLEEIMATFGVNSKKTLMIGDSITDIEMANAANVDAIGINFYEQEDLKKELLDKGALIVFDSYKDLASYLALE